METQNLNIRKWMLLLFKDQGSEIKFVKYPNFMGIVKDEIVSPEHIFLILYNKGYVRSHSLIVDRLKEDMASGLNPSFNYLSFHITDAGLELVKELRDIPESDESQLTLELE